MRPQYYLKCLLSDSMFVTKRCKWIIPVWFGLVGLVFSACGSTGYPRATEDQFGDFLSESDNERRFRDVVAFFERQKVADVVPIQHLLRQGTDWKNADLPPFAIPSEELWPNVVNTLIVLRDDVIPTVGPVEVLSAFRTEEYNSAAGGAKRSKHLEFSAVDVIPINDIDRDELHSKLKAMWSKEGPEKAIGLGLYSKLRFHIDTGGFRTW